MAAPISLTLPRPNTDAPHAPVWTAEDGTCLPPGEAAGRLVGTTPFGDFAVFSNDMWFAHFVRQGAMFEDDVVQHPAVLPHVKSARAIVDIGAHVGSHTVMYAVLNPAATVVAVEPQAAMAGLLAENTARFGGRVRIVRAALAHAAEPGAASHDGAALHNGNALHNGDALHDGELAAATTTLDAHVADSYNAKRPVAAGVRQLFNLGGVGMGPGGERVPLTTLDALALPACDYIKLDVEGAEVLVLLGGLATLRAHRPVILYEDNAKRLTPEMAAAVGFPAWLRAQPQNVRDMVDAVLAHEHPTAALLSMLGYDTFTQLPWQNVLATAPALTPAPALALAWCA